ncbi:hypothetical protein HYY75_00455, partial [bacterium]|nr:hypothetical protein [bacterium]
PKEALDFSIPATFVSKGIDNPWMIAVGVSVVLILWAVWQSKRETSPDKL